MRFLPPPVLGERLDTVSQQSIYSAYGIEPSLDAVRIYQYLWRTLSMFRRLEDRIRELCALAVSAEEPELEIVLAELQAALREHTERLRRLAAAKLTTLDENAQQERRAI
jgi:hypothetical protein